MCTKNCTKRPALREEVPKKSTHFIPNGQNENHYSTFSRDQNYVRRSRMSHRSNAHTLYSHCSRECCFIVRAYVYCLLSVLRCIASSLAVMAVRPTWIDGRLGREQTNKTPLFSLAFLCLFLFEKQQNASSRRVVVFSLQYLPSTGFSPHNLKEGQPFSHKPVCYQAETPTIKLCENDQLQQPSRGPTKNLPCEKPAHFRDPPLKFPARSLFVSFKYKP
jgi:hypothetical protein